MNKYKYEVQHTEQAEKVLQKLKENGGYCPCSIVKNESTKCICESFKTGEQVEEGICHCGLYKRIKLEDF